MPLAEWSAQFLPDYILEHMELTPDEKEFDKEPVNETDKKAGEKAEVVDA